MKTTSEFLDKARDKANQAFDDHCNLIDSLSSENSTQEDAERLAASKLALDEAQDNFEGMLR